jgi:hypothetical protein
VVARPIAALVATLEIVSATVRMVNIIRNYVPQLQSIQFIYRQLKVAQVLYHANSINVIHTQVEAMLIAAFLVVATLRGVNVTIREVNPIRNYIP